jgi:Zn-dependent protease with chaperone function
VPLIGSYLLLVASPWLVRHFLEGRLSPRALVWTYLAALLSVGAATMVGLVALLLRYLPHEYLTLAGLTCQTEDGCETTMPLWANAAFSFLIGGIVLGLVLFAFFAAYGQVSSTRRTRQDVIDVCSGPAPLVLPVRLRGRTLLIEDPYPLSYTVGFVRPHVVISTGLFDTLDYDEIGAVLAHEEGHVAARDNLVALLAYTFAATFALVPGVALALSRLRRAQEMAADDFACRCTGDSLVVASSLQKFARSLFGRRPAASLGFAEEGDVTERIEGLVFGRTVRSSRRLAAAVFLGLALLFGAFSTSALASTGVTFDARTAASGECHERGAGEARVIHGTSCEAH